ncbi:MAG: hypothetical protein HY951_03915 [Bacteroidia bacterium]|nr:hypothetical protein [Bacteroidia bacterium]
MEENKHPVDNLFSKGIEGFQMEPSPEIKRKVFASPSAIKPIKPWFIGINWMLITVSVIATASFIIYFGFNNNIQSNNTAELNKNNITNSAIEITNTQNTNSNIENENAIKQENKKVVVALSQSPEHVDGGVKGSATENNENDVKISKANNNIKNINETVKYENINTIAPEPIDKLKTNYKTENKNIENKQIAENNNKEISKDKITTNSVAEKSNTDKQVVENNSSDLANNSANTKDKFELSLSSSSQIEFQIEKSSILLFMERKTILLLSQQIAECMKLLSEKPAHFNKGLWYAEIKVGAFDSKYKVKSKSDEFKPAADAKQEMLKPSIGYDFGTNVVYQRNKLIFKAGLNYNNYGEKLSGNLFLTNPYNSEQINFVNNPYDVIVNGNYYNYDTLGSYYHYTYVQTDQIIKVDSVLAWHVQKVLVDMYDTTNVTKFDTLPKTTIYNNIKYFEVPLSFGYVFPMRRFNIAVNANIAPGYFIAVSGSQMNTENYPALEPYSKTTIQKFTLSAGVSFELGYMINESLTLIAEPYYKRSLLPMYSSKSNINQSNQNFGFRIGIRKLL